VVNNSNIDAHFEKNILTLTPIVASGHSKVKILMSSADDVIEKEFDIIIFDQKIYFGKDFTINSVFDTQTELEKHKVILEGSCTISGQSQGYGNQAFFTALLDDNNIYLSSMDKEMIYTSNLAVDFYNIQASLKESQSNYGGYFPYDEEHNGYTLHISCPDAQNDITTITQLLNISMDQNSYTQENILPKITIDNNISLLENTAKIIPFVYTDQNGDSVTVSMEINPTNGTVSLGVNTLSYTPNTNFNGEDSFVVKFDDGNGGIVYKTIVVNIIEINDIPIVDINTSLELNENSSKTFSYSYSDDNNDKVTTTIQTYPTNGVVSINDIEITYILNENFNGEDSFELSFDDGNGGVVSKTILVKIAAVNYEPIIDIPTSLAVMYDANKTIQYSYSDADNDTVTASIKLYPSKGTVAIEADTITYTPNINEDGEDGFVLSFDDGNGGIVDKQVNIVISKVNYLPEISVDTNITTEQNLPVSIYYNAIDKNNDEVNVTVTTQTNGTVSIAQNTITYTPNKDFNGTDSFTLQFNDNNGGIVEKTIVVEVIKTIVYKDNNVPSVRISTDIDMEKNSTKVIPFVAVDVDNDIVTVSSLEDPLHGTLEIFSNTISYKPSDANFTGTDSFKIEFNDGKGGILEKFILVKVVENLASVQTLSLKNGWNLISANLDLANIPLNVRTLWQYSDTSWAAYSSYETLQNTIENSGTITPLQTVINEKGTWVESIGENTLYILENSSDTNTTYVKQWTLGGTSKDLNVSDIKCMNEKQLNSVWKYSQGWSVYTPLDIATDLDTFDTIKANEGFWVNCN